ncbi:Lrp/AsnC family transcriptional regulator [Nocardioides cavernaquae]|uniref:Lrp/AsnC family transcriptional regulator n=1 Tax=Nocardioides cavernaquae TaxID=2321396 RepID=A0A3A5H6F0_9ACTN|nr:Lrp/AsnC family transcriptional regulator [Nocardioides cavernaquae]RJS46122.1 Lrp/AsnC family transcriptional regulator [Nocardioides cavernaquae]
MRHGIELDEIDLALLTSLHEAPQIGVLETSRRIKVARATVQARLRKLEEAGVIAGYQPQIDLAAAGFGVQCFVQLHIAQGELDSVADELAEIPGVLEAWATTGDNDILCRVAAASHEGLQETLVQLSRQQFVARSSSIVVLSTIVKPRTLPLLQTVEAKPSRAPRYPR